MPRGFRIPLWLALFALLTPALLPAFAKPARKPAGKKAPPPPVEAPRPPLPEELPAVAPTVTYRDGQLTIVAENSTLQDILAGVRKATGATVDAPAASASERVATHLGPGQPREVLAALLNGSRFDYILLSPAGNPGGVRRLILSPRSGSGAPAAEAPATSPPGALFSQPARPVPGARTLPPDSGEGDESAPEESVEPAQEVAPQPEAPAPTQPEVKTPQQIQDEFLRRQEEQRQQQQQQQQEQPPQ